MNGEEAPLTRGRDLVDVSEKCREVINARISPEQVRVLFGEMQT